MSINVKETLKKVAAAADAAAQAPAQPSLQDQAMQMYQQAQNQLKTNPYAAAGLGAGLGGLVGGGIGYGIGGGMGAGIGAGLGALAGGAGGYYGQQYMNRPAATDVASQKAAEANWYLNQVLSKKAELEQAPVAAPGYMEQLQNYMNPAITAMQGYGNQALTAAQGYGNEIAANPYMAAAGAGIGAGLGGLAGYGLGGGMGAGIGAGLGALAGSTAPIWVPELQQYLTPEQIQQVEAEVAEAAEKQAAADYYTEMLTKRADMLGVEYDPAPVERAQQLADINSYVHPMLGYGLMGAGVGAGLGGGIGAIAGNPAMGAGIGAGLGGLAGLGYGAYGANTMRNLGNAVKLSDADVFLAGLMKLAEGGNEEAAEMLNELNEGEGEEDEALVDAAAEVVAADENVVNAAHIAATTDDPNVAAEAGSVVVEAVDGVVEGASTDPVVAEAVADAAQKSAAAEMYFASLGLTKEAAGFGGAKNLVKSVYQTMKGLVGQTGKSVAGGAKSAYSGTKSFGKNVGGAFQDVGTAVNYKMRPGAATKGLTMSMPVDRKMFVGSAGVGKAMANPYFYGPAAGLGAAGLGGAGYAGYNAFNTPEVVAQKAAAYDWFTKYADLLSDMRNVSLGGNIGQDNALLNMMREASTGTPAVNPAIAHANALTAGFLPEEAAALAAQREANLKAYASNPLFQMMNASIFGAPELTAKNPNARAKVFKPIVKEVPAESMYSKMLSAGKDLGRKALKHKGAIGAVGAGLAGLGAAGYGAYRYSQPEEGVAPIVEAKAAQYDYLKALGLI